MKPQRVIFRRKFNPLTKQWGFLACFPDYETNVNCIAVIPFHFDSNGNAVFEPYRDTNIDYFLKRKIVHKNDPDIPKCVEALKNLYGGEYKVCEKR